MQTCHGDKGTRKKKSVTGKNQTTQTPYFPNLRELKRVWNLSVLFQKVKLISTFENSGEASTSIQEN